ncbi:hypothetical protein [Pseudoprimorskyibacter insulae]|uniref:Uncharacterized protein n=1 Tax=Pseudoprimorskyibacter insulae TaxID=1695997 RepID=A0A2R8AQ31_9RHOB|nr:hypothetical protein [Pseudoprimorskyibacter insulae]SPF77979.1 hypothetical protein PRI8871_00568 [Pseudoprimorskyibacter insulae]
MAHIAHLPEDDALAADYALGLLPNDKRRDVDGRMISDAEFRTRVFRWHARFTQMGEGLADLGTPDWIKASAISTIVPTPEPQRYGVRGWRAALAGLAVTGVASLLVATAMH